MRHTALYLGGVGALSGVVMMIAGVKSRELNTTLFGYGALLGFLSLLVMLFARVFINNRD